MGQDSGCLYLEHGMSPFASGVLPTVVKMEKMHTNFVAFGCGRLTRCPFSGLSIGLVALYLLRMPLILQPN